MPRLRVLAGPSFDKLVPISANSDVPVDVSSDAFEGKVAVYIKGFADPRGHIGDSPYFEQEERRGITWSIQVQGRFLRACSADDVLFGNTFARPLKLPWGFGAALKFMQYVDPTLEQDLASKTQPWALSPLIATMPYLEHRRIAQGAETPPFPPQTPVRDEVAQLRRTDGDGEAKADVRPGKRRSHFQNAARRKEVIFGPEDLITADFCYDYLRFSPNGVDLRLPGGLSIDMMKYWDGQPVRFVCCERVCPGSAEPWGRVFWCVVIEQAEDEQAGSEKEHGDSD
ncbi:hypothetical protein B0H21DRAFT_701400 [Amylocystis lapponica]|nr:hypothetical protein B0H21DRAFT_701400 [Amylocystis lapponica]